jgi:hypothetical protein
MRTTLLLRLALQQLILDQPHRSSAPGIVGAHPQPAVAGSDDGTCLGIAHLKLDDILGAADSALKSSSSKSNTASLIGAVAAA